MLRLKEMFSFSDEDNTHNLGPGEIVSFLVEGGHKEPDEYQVAEILEMLDRDMNGSISFEELWDWWVQYCIESGKLQGVGLEASQAAMAKLKAEAAAEHEARRMNAVKEEFLMTSPRQLMLSPGKGMGSTHGSLFAPRPPGTASTFGKTLSSIPPLRTPVVPKLPLTARSGVRGFTASAKGDFYRNSSGGRGTTASGQSFTPRCMGSVETAKVSPKLSPLMRHRSLTHRGPATISSGFKV